jgi:hypothetical protein
MIRHAQRLVPALAAGLSLVAGWGCGDKPSVSSSTTEATVKGKVLLNGKPATKGEVVFDPSNYQRREELPRRAPIAKDGTYTITTLVGVNSVTVTGPEAMKVQGLDYAGDNFDVQPGENTYDIVFPPPATP